MPTKAQHSLGQPGSPTAQEPHQAADSDGLVAHESEQPTIDVGAMPGEQHMHGQLVARRNASTRISSEEDLPALAATSRHTKPARERAIFHRSSGTDT